MTVSVPEVAMRKGHLDLNQKFHIEQIGATWELQRNISLACSMTKKKSCILNSWVSAITTLESYLIFKVFHIQFVCLCCTDGEDSTTRGEQSGRYYLS